MFSSPAATISFPPASASVAPQAAGSPQDQTRLAGVAAAQLAALDSSMYAGQFVALAQLFAEARWASLDDAPTSVHSASILVEMDDANLGLLLQQELVPGDSSASACWRVILPHIRVVARRISSLGTAPVNPPPRPFLLGQSFEGQSSTPFRTTVKPLDLANP